ncbi:hypothetical protein GQ53DRAFT_760429 [Thozetella sp. PMI_491]|nr:hypothetical protein GQ53DRAFT_760429 [Thozetella sp. PMI_491]
MRAVRIWIWAGFLVGLCNGAAELTNSAFDVVAGQPYTLTWINASGGVTIDLMTGSISNLVKVMTIHRNILYVDPTIFAGDWRKWQLHFYLTDTKLYHRTTNVKPLYDLLYLELVFGVFPSEPNIDNFDEHPERRIFNLSDFRPGGDRQRFQRIEWL